MNLLGENYTRWGCCVALAMLGAVPASAQFVIPNGDVVAVPPGAPGTSLANGETVIVGGTVNATGPNVSAITGAGNNTVTIENTGILTGSGANSNGILITGDGEVTAAGNITTNTGGGNTGNGIRIFGNGTVNHSGLINTSTGGGNSATGINVALAGDLTNSGSITTNAGVAGINGVGMSAAGLNQPGTGPSTLLNTDSGVIDVTAFQFARGMAINRDGGQATNNGTIVTNGQGGGAAEGIVILGTNSTAINTGSITVNGTGSFLNGMSLSGNDGATTTGAMMNNSGTINVTGTNGVAIVGLFVNGDGDITNSNDVTVTGTNGMTNGAQITGSGSFSQTAGTITATDNGVVIDGSATGFSVTGGSVIGQNGAGFVTDTGVNGNVLVQDATVMGDTFGIASAGDVTGSIMIQNATVEGTNDLGIEIGGGVGNGISVINSTVQGELDGIFIFDTVTGDVTVTNSTISTALGGGDRNAILLNNGVNGNVIINNGATMVMGRSYGLRINGNVSESVTLNGTIEGDNNDAVFIDGNVGGDVTANGNLTGDNRGLRIIGDVDGNLSIGGNILGMNNEGVRIQGSIGMDATLDGTIEGSSNGVRIFDSVGGNLSIGGMITGNGDNAVRVQDGVVGNAEISGTLIGATNGLRINDPVGGNLTTDGAMISGAAGRGIFINGVGGDVAILDSTITGSGADNEAVRISAGGTGGNLTVSGSMLSGDAATGLFSNGVGGNVTISDSTITGVGAGTFGVDIDGDVGGNFTVNNGSTMIEGATGIGVNGNIGGDLTVDGMVVGNDDLGVLITDGVTGDANFGGDISGVGVGLVIVNGVTNVNVTGTVAAQIGDGMILDSAGTVNSITIDGGTVQSTGFGSGLIVDGNVNTFTNQNGGLIQSGAFGAGLDVDGDLGTFINEGGSTITAGIAGPGVFVSGEGNSFLNDATSQITGLAGVDYGSFNGTGTNAGTIMGMGGGPAFFVDGNYTGTFNQNGTMSSDDEDGFEVDGDFVGTFNQRGTLSADDDAFDLEGNFNGTFNNWGSILANDDGVDIVGDFTGNFTNFFGGTIMSEQNGTEIGNFDGTYTNAGTIVSMDNDGAQFEGDFNGTFNNSGVIAADDDAIQFEGNVTGTINNMGMIMAGDTGINFNGVVNGPLTVNNTGMIDAEDIGIETRGGLTINNMSGAVVNGDLAGIAKDTGGALVVNNDGTITSVDGQAIAFAGAPGADSITNTGTISTLAMDAALNLGAGDDTLNDTAGQFSNGGGTRVIGFGAGNDTANFTQTTVSRGEGINDGAMNFAAGDDVFTVNINANIDGLYNGGAGTDTQTLNLWGVTAQQVLAAVSNGTAMIDGNGNVVFGTDFGTIELGTRIYNWTSFESSTVTANSFVDIFDGLTPNQEAIAAALDIAVFGTPGPDMEFVLLEIISIVGPDPAALPSILNSLSPQSQAEAFRKTGINNATFFRRNLENHFDGIFTDGFESGDTNAWSFNNGSGVQLDASGFELIDPTQNLKLQRMDRRLASLGLASGVMSDVPGAAFGGLDLAASDASYDPKAMIDSKKMIDAPLDDPRRFGLWLSGQGILADVNQADGDVEDFNYDTVSVTAGLDYRVNREVVVGVLFNWGNTDAAIDGNGSRQENNTYSGGAYAAWQSQDDGWFANGFVAGGASEYNQSRRMAFGAINRTALSDPSGMQFTTGAKSGYLFNLDRGREWKLGPVWGLQYTHLEQDAYTETGAGSLNLNVGEQDVDSLRSALGVKFQGRWQVTRDVALQPSITAEWLHEFLDDSTGVTGAFSDPAPGSFVVRTEDPDRDFGLVGFNLSALIGEEWSAFLAYDAQFSQDYLGHSVSGGARFEF